MAPKEPVTFLFFSFFFYSGYSFGFCQVTIWVQCNFRRQTEISIKWPQCSSLHTVSVRLKWSLGGWQTSLQREIIVWYLRQVCKSVSRDTARPNKACYLTSPARLSNNISPNMTRMRLTCILKTQAHSSHAFWLIALLSNAAWHYVKHLFVQSQNAKRLMQSHPWVWSLRVFSHAVMTVHLKWKTLPTSLLQTQNTSAVSALHWVRSRALLKESGAIGTWAIVLHMTLLQRDQRGRGYML